MPWLEAPVYALPADASVAASKLYADGHLSSAATKHINQGAEYLEGSLCCRGCWPRYGIDAASVFGGGLVGVDAALGTGSTPHLSQRASRWVHCPASGSAKFKSGP